MSATTIKEVISMKRLLSLATMVALTWAAAAKAASPGISDTTGTGTTSNTTFNLDATDAFINQPDGNHVYYWVFRCTSSATVTPAPTFVPANLTASLSKLGASPSCSTMQIPGPTLVVTEGAT